MKATEYRKNFMVKLNLACSIDQLRPVLNQIIFEDGYVITTNAHILVKQKLEHHGFESDEIEQMNGHCVSLETFKEIYRAHSVYVQDGKFTCISKKGVKYIIEMDTLGEMKYPNFEAVIPPSKDKKKVDQIGMDSKIIAKVKDLILEPLKIIQEFHGENKAMIFRSSCYERTDEIVLVMPKTI